jgi:hypothetical protein
MADGRRCDNDRDVDADRAHEEESQMIDLESHWAFKDWWTA